MNGCSGVMPSGGPRSYAFDTAREEHVSAEEGNLPFVLVDVDRKTLDALKGTTDSAFFKGSFTDRSPPNELPIGIGDTVRVTIFEAGSGGLFVPAGGSVNNGNYVVIPDQEVDRTGAITVPYADKNGDGGLIAVDGRSVSEVQEDIRQRLMNRAIEPQIVVTVVQRTSNLYSVIGDVNEPGRFALSQGGQRILDALSAAGGPKGADYNTFITLQRGGSSATASLNTLLSHAENNIFVQPNDVIAIKKEERYYNVLGATHVNNRIPFDAASVTVADALAKAGGLDSNMAAAATVVVFRREEPKVLEEIGADMTNFNASEPVPTVYRFNFTGPSGMFLAQKMQLRHDDVVYVSNHLFNDAAKLLSVLRDVLLIKLIDD